MKKISLVLVGVALISMLLLTGCGNTYDNADLLNCKEGTYKVDKDVKGAMKEIGISVKDIEVVKQSDFECRAVLEVKPNLLMDTKTTFANCVLDCVEQRMEDKCMMDTIKTCVINGEEKEDQTLCRDFFLYSEEEQAEIREATGIETIGFETRTQCNKYRDWRDLSGSELEEAVFDSCCQILI